MLQYLPVRTATVFGLSILIRSEERMLPVQLRPCRKPLKLSILIRSEERMLPAVGRRSGRSCNLSILIRSEERMLPPTLDYSRVF